MRPSTFKVIITAAILSLIGFFLLPQLPIQLSPSMKTPKVSITFNWPNSSPYHLERKVTSNLESGMSTIRGIDKIKSTSFKNYGRIDVQFADHISIDMARFQVANKVRQIYESFPNDVSYPVISLNKPNGDNQLPFLTYNITAPYEPFQIKEEIDREIIPILNNINGIDKLEVYGANRKEWIIEYNTSRLKNLSISKEELIQAIKLHFQPLSIGRVIFKNKQITLKIIPGKDISKWNIPVKKIGNRIIWLDQIASIESREKKLTQYFRVNGANAITVALYPKEGINTVSLAKKIGNRLKATKANLGDNFEVYEITNSTRYIQDELHKILKRSLWTIFILLVIILVISRSYKYLLIIILGITSNIAIAFVLYFLFGVEIQLYSLAGITISLGLIIDNTIVMIDHIMTRNNTRVILPILASTLTTIGALTIIYFIEEEYKNNLIDFALVIIINLIVSIFIALLLIPALIKKFNLTPKSNSNLLLRFQRIFLQKYRSFLCFCIKYKALLILGIILLFGIPLFMLPERLENKYGVTAEFYNKTIGSDVYSQKLRPVIDKYLGGSLRLFSYYVFENAYYTTKEETKLNVIATMDEGATIDHMNEAFLQIENFLSQFPQVKQFKTKITSGESATMEITFKEPFIDSSFPFILKSNLVRKALDLGGVDWNIFGVGNGYNSESKPSDPINFRVKALGYDYSQLNQWADSLKKELNKHARVQNVIIRDNNPIRQPLAEQYYFKLNNASTSLFKQTPLGVFKDIKQKTLSKFQDFSLSIDGKYTPVRFKSQESSGFDIWHIMNTPMGNKTSPYKLNNSAKIEIIPEVETVYKEDQQYIRLVEFQYTGAQKFGNSYLRKTLKKVNQQIPMGFSFEKSEIHSRPKLGEKDNYGLLLLIIGGIIYIICAVLFESFSQPFIILSIIPISFIGVFLTFYLFDLNFDQGGIASFILLSGLSVNASIFILNEFNYCLKTAYEKDKIDFFLEAFNAKIFPILLTIISTAVGFLPFILAGENEVFWFSLGAGTIGGLLFSLIAILIYLPIFSLNRKNTK